MAVVKKHISISIWSTQHPNAGQHTQIEERGESFNDNMYDIGNKQLIKGDRGKGFRKDQFCVTSFINDPQDIKFI